MPMQLTNLTKANEVIASDLQFAETFFQRAFGLMGKKPLPQGQALMFKGTRLMPSNSIQTTFMRFSLDLLFLDSEMKVKAIQRNVKPWRVTWPVGGAVNAVEMTAGALETSRIEIGDQLHVGD
jgi:uncharacterized membrane protein (UPF0127 family)